MGRLDKSVNSMTVRSYYGLYCVFDGDRLIDRSVEQLKSITETENGVHFGGVFVRFIVG
jgi:hypothetical protein